MWACACAGVSAALAKHTRTSMLVRAIASALVCGWLGPFQLARAD